MVIDIIGLSALVLCFFPLLIFFGILVKQYGYYDSDVYPLQILNIRTAIILPVFAIFLCISVFFPYTFHIWDTIEAILEGYCVTSFHAMVVLNCGGPGSVIKFLENSDRVLCFSFQKKKPKSCYRRVYTAIWQFTYIRPIIVFTSTLAFYVFHAQIIFQLIQGICFLQTFYMLTCFLVFTYNLYEECYGLCVVYKLMVMKISVGLVTFQGFLFDNLFEFGLITIPDEYSPVQGFAQKDRVMRAYCILCLVEFLLLCLPLWYGFAPRIETSAHYSPRDSIKDHLALIADSNIPALTHEKIKKVSICRYLYDIFNAWHMPASSFSAVRGISMIDKADLQWLAVGNEDEDDTESVLN